eukprot:IDg12562t1
MELFPTGQSSAPPKEGEYSKDQLDAIKTEHQSKYKTISNWEQLEIWTSWMRRRTHMEMEHIKS